MSLVKAKDMPYETACLEKRIQFVSDLKTVLGKNSLVSQTVDLYTDLIEDILYDVCLDVHRDIVMGIERDAVGSHPGEDQGEERVARRTSGTRHSDPSGSHADALEPLDETKETVEVAHASGSRKRQARARSPPGSGRQTSKRRSEGTEPNKGSKEADADRGKGGHVEETTAEPLTMEEMLKQAAIHYGSATMLGVQMSYVTRLRRVS